MKVTTYEAKTQLSKLITRVLAGEEFVICRGSVPAARLVPFDPTLVAVRKRPRVGTTTSKPVGCEDDAFAPLTDAELGEWGL